MRTTKHPTEMSFATQITRTSIAYSQERAKEASVTFTDVPEGLRGVITGAAGCSPYLAMIMGAHATWLTAAVGGPDQAVADILTDIRQLPLDALKPELRKAKAKISALVAIADLGGMWPLDKVTGTLTEFADAAVDVTIKALIAVEIKRGKLPEAGLDDVATAAGMVVLAMGKMGAGELNYSSDIDLICLFDESRYSADAYHEARASFIRVTRKMSAILSDITGDGYVFRTDLRLRPDPSATPVCLSMDAAMRYYESLGRTWERAAHIKARPCAGDIAAGEKYLQQLAPFIWRKHLDFASIQDAHDMRLRIRAHKGLGGAITLEGHNMKLGRGGIREIEFFTQTRQIIAGGRDISLRSRETVPALLALAQKGWVPKNVANSLISHYQRFRDVEHRLQMVNDAQTHDLPKTPEDFDRLAQFMGCDDTAKFREKLQDDLSAVHEITESFFIKGEETGCDAPELWEGADDIIARWSGYPALKSARAVDIFERLRPEILTRLQKAADPHGALIQFDGFLAGLPAGVQLFALFQANPQLIDLIVDICATSPALAAHLSSHSQVLDAVIGGDFFCDWPGCDALTEQLANALTTVEDYETQLDTARRWMKEWHFRIGVHHLRGLINGHEAGAQYANLARATLINMWQVVGANFAKKHGPKIGRGAVVLAMGSLGAGCLNAASDLDLIVIYDADGVEISEGRRPLMARTYYARLTQALVTALSAPMSEGRLYEVDMRLRPSGRQGPVATSLQSFKTYQLEEAWTWEHLALTRADVAAGSQAVAKDVTECVIEIISKNRFENKVLHDVVDMKSRLHEQKKAANFWDVKAGIGRMQDIELTAQTSALLSGSSARNISRQLRAGWVPNAQADILSNAYNTFLTFRNAAKLLSESPIDMAQMGEGAQAFVLREMGSTTIEELQRKLQAIAEEASVVIDNLLLTPQDSKE